MRPPIGIFDSGIGGLTVARAVADVLPDYPLVYFGDTAHLPYGEKSPELIRHFSSRISHHLRDEGCRLVVVACNSASSNALDAVRDALGPRIPVVDVVSPVVAFAAAAHPGGRVGVIGTRATIESGVYQRALTEQGLTPIVRATPLLASAIEEGFHTGSVSDALLEAYLGDGLFSEVDAMVLGCTHYPLIADQIRAFLPIGVDVLDTPGIVADAVRIAVENMPSSRGPKAVHQRRFIVSDLTASFASGARTFFGREIELEESRIWEI